MTSVEKPQEDVFKIESLDKSSSIPEGKDALPESFLPRGALAVIIARPGKAPEVLSRLSLAPKLNPLPSKLPTGFFKEDGSKNTDTVKKGDKVFVLGSEIAFDDEQRDLFDSTREAQKNLLDAMQGKDLLANIGNLINTVVSKIGSWIQGLSKMLSKGFSGETDVTIKDTSSLQTNINSALDQKKQVLAYLQKHPVTATAEQKETGGTLKDVQASIEKFGMKDAGIYIKDLQTGETATLNAEKSYPAASIIKIPVMATVMQEIQEGRLQADTLLTIQKEDVAGTWAPANDPNPPLKAGDKVPVKKLLEVMIARSDNTATNTLASRIKMSTINTYMGSLGYSSVQLHNKLNQANTTGLHNAISPVDTGKMLEAIAKKQLVSPQASEEMLRMLAGQMDNSKIPAGLPQGAKFLHKTGETGEVTHDAGIIRKDGKEYVMVAFTKLAPGTGTPKIAALTKAVSPALFNTKAA